MIRGVSQSCLIQIVEQQALWSVQSRTNPNKHNTASFKQIDRSQLTQADLGLNPT